MQNSVFYNNNMCLQSVRELPKNEKSPHFTSSAFCDVTKEADSSPRLVTAPPAGTDCIISFGNK